MTFTLRVGLLATLLSVILSTVNAQTIDNHRHYWIEFTNKQGSPFSISSPNSFLSKESIERRMRQKIALTEMDLPVNPSYLSAIRNTGVQIVCVSKWLNGCVIYSQDSLKLVAAAALSFVKKSEAIAPRPAHLRTAKNEKLEQIGNFSETTSGEDYYGKAANQIKMLHGDYLHQLGYTGEGMLIAQLDAGWSGANQIDAFKNLFNEGRILRTYSFVNATDFVYNSHSHGTAVLSTMAAELPGTMVGTCPHATYILLQSENGATEYPLEECFWAAAAELADSLGASVINSSLGYTEFDDSIFDHKYADLNGRTAIGSRAALAAARAGIIVVNAAGNEGQSAWHYIGVPADADSILTVGAIDSIRQHAPFSSYGPTADGRVKPDVCAQGLGTYVCDPLGNIGPGNGTSFASPVIAGLTACLWQAHPLRNNMEVIRAIQQSANQYSTPDGAFGYGLPNFQIANGILTQLDFKNLTSENRLPVLFPNPSGNQDVYVLVKSDFEQKAKLKAINSIGEVVFTREIDLPAREFSKISLPELKQTKCPFLFINLELNNKNTVLKWVR